MTSGYRKAGCGWKMLEKMQDVLFLFSVLDTLLETSQLGKPRPASELETKMCCFSVHCVSRGAALLKSGKDSGL